MNALDNYHIIFSTVAWKSLMSLTERLQDAIFDKIYTLELDPRPSGCKKLKGKEVCIAFASAIQRVIYTIEDEVLVVVVVKVIDRKEGTN